MEVIKNPPENWMELLRRGCKVRLSKSQEMAEVAYPYEAAEPGHICGLIGIRIGGHIQSWHIGLNGEGIDGSQLLEPLEGNLPENPEPLPEPLIRQMQRQLEFLERRVRRLESDAVHRRFGGVVEMEVEFEEVVFSEEGSLTIKRG